MYDYIIVGGGAAGAVVARRLSETASQNVLLLEAGIAYAPGEYPENVRQQTVIGNNPDHDWGYTSEPSAIGRSLALPRGKLLGGCTAMNGSVAMRTPQVDHARWNEQHGLQGWSWDDVMPAFKRMERTSSGEDDLHGRDGPFPIHQLGSEEVSDMQRAFIESATAIGYPRVKDFNGREPFGVGPYPMNTRMGTRLNTGVTYLDARTRSRKNLTIRGESQVDKVLLNASGAFAVQLTSGEIIEAQRIILSAGTYGSPAILMRSGIGPADHLEQLGISVNLDCPVGKRLQDHPFFFTIWAAHKDRLGLPVPPVGAILWARSQNAPPEQLNLHVTAVHYGDPAMSPTGAIFMLAVANTRPTSVGTLRLRSKNPTTAPIIDLAFLKEKEDRAVLVNGIELVRSLAATDPLKSFIHSELSPGPNVVSREQLEQALLSGLDTYHHPTSTVPMGGKSDSHAVLNEHGAVRGVSNLYVIDASIFPDVPSVATNVMTLVAAEHLAAKLMK